MRDSKTTMKKERKRSESVPRPTISQYFANVDLNKEARSLNQRFFKKNAQECSKCQSNSLRSQQDINHEDSRRSTLSEESRSNTNSNQSSKQIPEEPRHLCAPKKTTRTKKILTTPTAKQVFEFRTYIVWSSPALSAALKASGITQIFTEGWGVREGTKLTINRKPSHVSRYARKVLQERANGCCENCSLPAVPMSNFCCWLWRKNLATGAATSKVGEWNNRSNADKENPTAESTPLQIDGCD